MSTVPCFTSGQNNTGISQSWIGVCLSDVYWAPAMGTILYQAYYMYASLSQMPVSGSSDCAVAELILEDWIRWSVHMRR